MLGERHYRHMNKYLGWGRFKRIGLLAGAGFLALCLQGYAEIRQARVAGRFYPGDQAELLALVQDLLGRQPEPTVTQKPRILIVPHAGYQYSGLIAANGFRHAKGHTYDGVVVVGFTHRLQFEGASVDTRQAYQTPLGELPVHQEAVAVLQTYPGITHVEQAHASDEHSLEVELPFLQVVLGRTRLIPILIGSARLENARRLAKALAGLAGVGDFLFVFSTDLSHYHPYDEALRIDERTVNAIVFETPQAADRLFTSGLIEACGRGPIVTSLFLADNLGYATREILAHANSGDTAGDRSSVVGYVSIGMFDKPAPPSPVSLAAGQALVLAARQALEQSIGKRNVPPVELGRYPELKGAHGVFVTLRRHGALRGCIGRIETNEPLFKTVPVVALEAALHDTRFEPVRAAELGEIDVEVSVLTPPVQVDSPKEIVAGRDGVVLEHQGRHGVFLPQVWEETGWTRVEFLRELASQKAGLSPDAWQYATLYVFQDHVFQELSSKPWTNTQDGPPSEVEGEPLPASRIAH